LYNHFITSEAIQISFSVIAPEKASSKASFVEYFLNLSSHFVYSSNELLEKSQLKLMLGFSIKSESDKFEIVLSCKNKTFVKVGCKLGSFQGISFVSTSSLVISLFSGVVIFN